MKASSLGRQGVRKRIVGLVAVREAGTVIETRQQLDLLIGKIAVWEAG